MLASTNAAVTVPMSVTVPQGSASATFTATTSVVTSSISVNITATYGGVTQYAALIVVPYTVELRKHKDGRPLLLASLGWEKHVGNLLSGPPDWELTHTLRPGWLAGSVEDREATGVVPGYSDWESVESIEAALAASPPGPPKRNLIYSPEMNLLAESELTWPREKAILYEYIWFNGHPVTQIDGTAVTHWTFTDHLGTPLIQTTASQAIWWRAEYEPYGQVWTLRTADQHQPLRLPGQEAEQFNLGQNGATERSYNVFRWYRSSWGRYTQPDPLGLDNAIDLYSYSTDRPTIIIDPFGLRPCTACDQCPSGKWSYQGLGGSIGFIFGGSFSIGYFTCDRGLVPQDVPVTITCRLKGPIATIGGGVEFSIPGVPAACACNAGELYGTFEGELFSPGPVSASVGSCSQTGGGTLTIGVGRGAGGGIAHTTCTVRPR